MPWCPKCKYEYVAGKTICPDCKSELVDSLEEEKEKYFSIEDFAVEAEDEDEDDTEVLKKSALNAIELLERYQSGDISGEELQTIVSNLKAGRKRSKEYAYKKEIYEENKSSVAVLLTSGIVGIIVVILVGFGIIKVPMSGFSLYLSCGVMGGLFLIFAISGLKSLKRAKALAPLVAKEQEQIEEITKFLISKKEEGAFKIIDEDLLEEEKSLIISDLCVDCIEAQYPDLEEGFAFYITDRNYSEIFDDED